MGTSSAERNEGQPLSEATRGELGSAMLWALRVVLVAVTVVVVAFVIHAVRG